MEQIYDVQNNKQKRKKNFIIKNSFLKLYKIKFVLFINIFIQQYIQ